MSAMDNFSKDEIAVGIWRRRGVVITINRTEFGKIVTIYVRDRFRPVSIQDINDLIKDQFRGTKRSQLIISTGDSGRILSIINKFSEKKKKK